MKQLAKHIVRRNVAFTLIMIFALLALVTSGTEHLGWLLALTAVGVLFISWFLYEEETIRQLRAKIFGKIWIR